MQVASILALAALAMAPAMALANPWVGSWSLDPAASKYSPGPAHQRATMVVTGAGTGKLTFVTDITNGAGETDHSEFTCALDRVECPVAHAGAKQTVSLAALGTRELKLHWKLNDPPPFYVVMLTKLSRDGKAVVATSKGSLPDGTQLAVTEIWHNSAR